MFPDDFDLPRVVRDQLRGNAADSRILRDAIAHPFPSATFARTWDMFIAMLRGYTSHYLHAYANELEYRYRNRTLSPRWDSMHWDQQVIYQQQIDQDIHSVHYEYENEMQQYLELQYNWPDFSDFFANPHQFENADFFYIDDGDINGPSQIQILNQELIDEGEYYWRDVYGTHFYGLHDNAQMPYNVEFTAHPPLISTAFLPGNEAANRGPRLAFYDDRMDLHELPDHRPIHAIPHLPQNPYNKKSQVNEILDRNGIKLIKILFPGHQEAADRTVINHYKYKLRLYLTRILQTMNIQANYSPYRLFIHISVTARTIEDNQQVYLNFYFMFQPETFQVGYHYVRSFINRALERLEEGLKEALSTDYYYESIEGNQVEFLNVYLLLRHYRLDWTHGKNLVLAREWQAYHKLDISENMWNNLDLTRDKEQYRQHGCLERILLYLLNWTRYRGNFITLNQMKTRVSEIMNYAASGRVYIIYKYLYRFLSEYNNIYLFMEHTNSWVDCYKPEDKEKAFVIVLRDRHAILVQNTELYKYLKLTRYYFYLRPPQSRNTKILKFVFDIETYTLEKYQIPYLISSRNDNLSDIRNFWGENCVIEFIRYVTMISYKYSGSRVEFWSFNGSKFDNLLIIAEMLVLSSDVYILGSNTQIKIIKFHDVMFYDMILMYPGSLERVATYLGCVVHYKIPLNVAGKSAAWYEENKDKIIEYCQQDCEILRQIVDKHYEYKAFWGIENLYVGTNSAMSLKIYQTKFLKSSKCKLTGSRDLESYNRERSSYHGGFTYNVYRGVFNRPVYYYDINSSYPDAMTNAMPMEYIGSKHYQGEEIVEHFLYDVEGTWEKEVLLPIYCEPKTGDRELDGTLLYFTTFTRYFRWGCELKYAVEHKLFKHVKIHVVYYYTAGLPFRDFVIYLYEKRQQLRAEGKHELAYAVKLTLNSLYGKMGYRYFPEIVWCRYDGLSQYIIRDDLCAFEEIDEQRKLYRLYFETTTDLLFLGTLVRFAAYITAMGRKKLFTMFHQIGFENVLYCDTDSLMSVVPMAPQFISETELGKWKLEHTISNLTIWGPKFYRYTIYGTDVTTSHIKGVRAKNYTDELWQEIFKEGKAEIVNENVFKKKFGKVWVDSQKKLIDLKCPNRNFLNWKCRFWEGSVPFYDIKDFKNYHMLYADEVLSDMSIEEIDKKSDTKTDIIEQYIA